MRQGARWCSAVAVAGLGIFCAAPVAADQRARPAVAIGIGTGAPEMLHLDLAVPVVPAVSIEARLWGYTTILCNTGFGAEAGATGYAALGGAWWFLATVTGGWGEDSHGGGGICAGGGPYPAWLLRPAVGIAWRGDRAENRLQAGFIFRTNPRFLGGDLTKIFIPSLTYTHFF